MIATTSTRFEHELKKMIEDERAEVVKQMASGIPSDYSSYRECVGKIRAFNLVIELFEDVNTKLSKES